MPSYKVLLKGLKLKEASLLVGGYNIINVEEDY
jgi:hypothetical protein